MALQRTPTGTAAELRRHAICYMIEEDRIANIALGKTIVVLLYSVLIPMIAFAVTMWLEDEPLPNIVKEVIGWGIMLALLILLIFLVVKGWMPGSRIEVPYPFSETQLAWAVTLLSAVAWAVGLAFPVGIYIATIANAVLFLGVLVFFVTKTVISKRLRFGVLSALVLPGTQLAMNSIF